MDLALLVYGISVLGNIAPALGMLMFASFFAFVIALVYRLAGLNIESWDGEAKIKRKMEARPVVEKWAKRIFAVFAVSTILMVIIPSEKTAYMMVGAYATQKVAENEMVQQTGQKVLTLIEQKLDTYIDEGLKQAEKKAKDAVKGSDKK